MAIQCFICKLLGSILVKAQLLGKLRIKPKADSGSSVSKISLKGKE